MNIEPKLNSASAVRAESDGLLKLAILAVGGQGGGVLSNWIIQLAEQNGYYAQLTSVPGVAQRTGATIYYIEMMPDTGREPVLALMPSPGDVDVVIAAELMEAGRAVTRGLVSVDRTTVIASTHRMFAVSEKVVPGDGIAQASPVLKGVENSAKEMFSCDLAAIAEESGSHISASLFGALAGSETLPFKRDQYEQTIRSSGRGVEASLAAFSTAYSKIQSNSDDGAEADGLPAEPQHVAAPQSKEWDELTAKVGQFPEPVQKMALAGLAKVVDYQDFAYGEEYLTHLGRVLGHDHKDQNYALTSAAAKHVANAMTYDDIIRVADLKTRSDRFRRVQDHAGTSEEEVLQITEYFHPGASEVCSLLPRRLGEGVRNNGTLFGLLGKIANRGWRVRSDTIFWFGVLYMAAGLKRFRRKLLRHGTEAKHLSALMDKALTQAPTDYDLAVEVFNCQRLIKGYSDTHARGLSKFGRVITGIDLVAGRPDAIEWARRLQKLALAGESGAELDGALQTIRSFAGE